MSDYDDSKDKGHSQAPYPLHGRVRNQRRGGDPFMQTSSGMLPPRKTAPPAVVMRKADGSVAAPLPFTGIPDDLAAWAFQPHVAMAAPQTPVQARGDHVVGSPVQCESDHEEPPVRKIQRVIADEDCRDIVALTERELRVTTAV